MYNTFFRYFGLRENPFNVNPNPGYLYFNERTRVVLEDMASAIQAGKGLIVLTGEAGTGKTTLINRLKQWLEKQRIPTAFIFNPHLEVSELFDLLLAEYGISADAHLKGSSVARLNQWLRDRRRSGKGAVLILDEAQGLPLPILEQVRLLLNHEMPDERLLQIVLSGQPELEDKLKRPEMRQVRQRISLRCQTTGLTQDEAHAYIARRMQIAGGSGREVFAPDAIDAVHLYSRGIPRVLNVLCEHAMIRAYMRQTQPVPASMVAEVAQELQFDDVKPVAARTMRSVFSETPPQVAPALTEPVLPEPVPEAPVTSPAVAVASIPQSEPASQPVMAAAESPVATPTAPKWTWFDATLDGARQPRKTVPISNDPSDLPKLAVLLGLDEPNPTVHAASISRDASGNNSSGFSLEYQRDYQKADENEHERELESEEDPGLAVVSRQKTSKTIAQHPLVRESRDYLVVVFARVKPAVAQTWQKFAAYAKSQQWDRSFDSLLRWLQQPLPPVKVHRRAGD